MSLPKEFKANFHRAFIAYSYVYISQAIEALKQSPNAEAIVIQPYEAHKSFASAKEAVDAYRHLTHGQNIPILFTPQGRMAEEGQFFEYGARLLDVLDITTGKTRDSIEQNRKLGKWVLQHGDKLYSKKNLLIVNSPIIALPGKLPINVALNILSRNRGKEVEAVAIPTPKFIKPKHQEVFETL